ncbi:hypothetical protein ABIA16_005085 [Sinorhizobium fredii]
MGKAKEIAYREGSTSEQQSSAKYAPMLSNPAFCRVPNVRCIDGFGKRAIETGRDLFMPATGGVLEFNVLRRTGKLMVSRSNFGGGKCIGVGGKGLREDIVNFVRPSPVMLYYLILHLWHGAAPVR